MLILTRREGETVQLGETITVTVLKIGGCQVKLAFNAPQAIGSVRQEVLLDKQPSQQAT